MSKWCGDENCLQCADKEPDLYVHLPRADYDALREQNRVLAEAAKREIDEEQKRLRVACSQRDDAQAELERVRGQGE